MKLVTIHEAKTHLSKLIQAALSGEEVIIAKGKTPLIKLVVVASAKKERKLGSAKGLVTISSDFDEPLDDFSEYR